MARRNKNGINRCQDEGSRFVRGSECAEAQGEHRSHKRVEDGVGADMKK